VPSAADGTAASGAGTPAPWPLGACGRTRLRRAQRRCHVHLLRQRLGAAVVGQQAAAAQCQALLGLAGEPAGTTLAREQAVVAALRLHTAACRTAGFDEHWAGRALARAGWRDATSREILVRGAAARHHGLATVSDEAFAQLDAGALRRLQRGAVPLRAAAVPSVPAPGSAAVVGPGETALEEAPRSRGASAAAGGVLVSALERRSRAQKATATTRSAVAVFVANMFRQRESTVFCLMELRRQTLFVQSF
jgi:hypothetical protein